MRLKQWVGLTLLLSALLYGIPTVLADYEMTRGQVLRYYEDRSGEWKSYVLLKDSLDQERKYFVHATLTVVKRGPQIEPLETLVGGMHVGILHQNGENRASVITVEDGLY